MMSTSSTILVLLLFLLNHLVFTQRPVNDRMEAVWKKLHASKKGTKEMQSEPTGQPTLDHSNGKGVVNTNYSPSSPRALDKIRSAQDTEVASNVHSNLHPEVGCSFEEPCGWSWNKDLVGGFKISGSKGIGPPMDANNNKSGE